MCTKKVTLRNAVYEPNRKIQIIKKICLFAKAQFISYLWFNLKALFIRFL